jgi:hypothetical protein
MSKRSWTIEELKTAVKESINMSDALRRLGLTVKQGNYTTVYKYISMHKIDNSHWQVGKSSVKVRKSSQKQRLCDILIEKSSWSSTNGLKKRLIEEGLLANECSLCGLKDRWKGKPIVMILDHINGENNDNRIENLRIVCPNCNSQLETHCGKNKKKVKHNCKSCDKSLSRKTKTGLCCHCYWKINGKTDKKVFCECGKEVSSRNKTGKCISCAQAKRQRKRGAKKPSKEELRDSIDKNNWSELGRIYGVSDNAVRKWAKSYSLI